MTSHCPALSLEGHVSLDPRDYVWGPVSAAQQHQMFAQFMGMTQVALMCGCALLPPPGIAPPSLHHPSAAAPPLPSPSHAFPAFWPPTLPRPPMAPGPFPPVPIPMPEKPASALPLGPAPAACWAPAPCPQQRVPAAHKRAPSSCTSDLLAAAATTNAAAPEVKSASGSANPSPSRAPASTSAPSSCPRGAALKKRVTTKSSSKSKAGTGAKQVQQVQGSAAAAATTAPSVSDSRLAMPEGCGLDLLEALPLDLDDIRQLFQEDLAQELQQHQSLSSRTSQGSQDTMFHNAADAAIAGAPTCMGTELLLESLDGPLSLASFDQSFDQSFEQLSREFKAIGSSFDALTDLGSILDVHMDDDLALASLSAPGVLGSGSGGARPAATAGRQQTGQVAGGVSGVSKSLKLNRSKSGVMKKAGDKGAVKVCVPRGMSCVSLVDTPIEELLNFV